MSGRLLLAAHEVPLQQALSRLLHERGGFQVRLVATPDVLGHAELARFDGIVMAGLGLGLDMLAVLRRLRADDSTRDLPVVLLISREDQAVAAWAAGADGVFPETVDPAVLLARLATLVACWQRREGDRTRSRDLAESVRCFTDFAMELADAASPGLRSRGDEIAWIAGQLATRFRVPEEFYDDLLIAARLHGIGRAMLHDPPGAEPDPWRWAAVTASELNTIPSLRSTAELVAGSGEHWDGSGRPAGLQRGMIPLRSRILRVAVDLVDQAEKFERGHDAAGFAAAAASLLPHAGTLYDPAVVAEVEAMLLSNEPNAQEVRRVPVEQLEPGMMLAEDLVTASGVKLLAAGGLLTSASLATITRRHLSDPIVHAVRVRVAPR